MMSNVRNLSTPDPGLPRGQQVVARWPRDQDAEAIVGESEALRALMYRVEQVAVTEATVLLCGETGTGKELLARDIHRRSRRRDRPFVVVNCAALPATLIESELFGRERGAFTGADSAQAGRFELAHRGTVFLDEVGELPLELQPRLLRVLQEGQVERLGSPRIVDVDLRIVAATNRNLADDVRQGRFRRDLYYRLSVFPIAVPALRERRRDIGPLVRHLVRRFGQALGKPVDIVPVEVMQVLEAYDWPGNVRELENVIQRAVILSTGPRLSLAEAWWPMLEPMPFGSAETTSLREMERGHIQRVLQAVGWRIEGNGGAADLLGMKPSTLRSRMAKLKITRPTCGSAVAASML